jgi:RNA polymerase sigma-70 factor (ECF subfamily)
MDEAAPDSADTQGLLRRARVGDRQALGRLFAQHRPYLRRLVELRLDRRLRQRVDPSDVVQEAQLEAVRRLGGYLERPALPFRLWLRQLAYDRLLMARRRHAQAARRAVGQEVALPDRSSLLLAQQLLAGGSTPSQRLAQEELARRVRQAVAGLAEADREILLMRHAEELPYGEIARLLGIEADAARQRYGRALLRLRKVLKGNGLLESPP